MIRRFLILLIATSLSACALLPGRAPQVARAPEAPHPADGLWAILDPGCAKPATANFANWPACASPFWINQQTAVVVRSASGLRGGQGQSSYRAGLQVTAGEPVVVQVGSQLDGYVFVALTDISRDASGRVVAASGAPMICETSLIARITFRANATGCENRSSDEIGRAAAEAISDRESLTQVAWVAAGAPAAE
ncbi:MAG: hypothetical protein U1E50_06730 [Caulobacteraceae bacterium]